MHQRKVSGLILPVCLGLVVLKIRLSPIFQDTHLIELEQSFGELALVLHAFLMNGNDRVVQN